MILEALRKNQPAAMLALERRLTNTKTVQDVMELLAKLEGELSKDASARPRGVEVIILK